MNDHELLLAMSDMMDRKLNAQLEPIKNDITDIQNEISKTNVNLENEIFTLKNELSKTNATLKNELSKTNATLETELSKTNATLETESKNNATLKNEILKINFILENEIKPDIKLLAENYLPSAIRYEKSINEHEAMKDDIELLKRVVTEHSEKLQKIS